MVDFRFYVITAENIEKGYSHLDLAQAAIKGGVTLIQFREKNKSTRELLEIGFKLRELTFRAKIPLIVNDRLDIALAIGSEGIHIGQEDMPLTIARKLLGPKKIIGVSARNIQEAIEAERSGADYLGVGPIFETPSKEDAGEPIGCQTLRAIKNKVRIPVVAVGGVNLANLEEIFLAGADGVAVISAITGQADMVKAAKEMREKIDKFLMRKG